MRFKPEGASLLDAYPSCSQVFRVGGWHDYCSSLSGHHPTVSRAFVERFDKEKVEFKTFMLQVTKDSIAEATGLSIDGEKWFKRTALKPSDFNYLLVSDHKNPDWRKGTPRVWVKQEFKDLLYLIQKYITCEGRFALIFIYHLRLLSHLVKDQRLSLPFYFLKILTKMASKCKGLGEIADTYFFHHGLIKMLITHELQKVARSWNQFLRLEGFEAPINEPESLVMPRRTPSSRKDKDKVIDRILRSSASHDSKAKEWDTPLEPICNLRSEPSLAQVEERKPDVAAEQRECEADKRTKPLATKTRASTKSKKGATKPTGKKHKSKELSQGIGKPSEISTPRVTRRKKQVQKSDGGDSLMIESMAASSLVELSTSGKQAVSLSLS